jgi:hypothetical protein
MNPFWIMVFYQPSFRYVLGTQGMAAKVVTCKWVEVDCGR